jgi:hypothetical protein
MLAGAEAEMLHYSCAITQIDRLWRLNIGDDMAVASSGGLRRR